MGQVKARIDLDITEDQAAVTIFLEGKEAGKVVVSALEDGWASAAEAVNAGLQGAIRMISRAGAKAGIPMRNAVFRKEGDA